MRGAPHPFEQEGTERTELPDFGCSRLCPQHARFLSVLSVCSCSILFCLLLSPSAVAHEVRPAYLELRETAPETYDVLWKVPAQGENMRFGLFVELPADCTNVTEPRGSMNSSAFTESWSVKRAGGLSGGIIHIAGLSGTMTDVLVHLPIGSNFIGGAYAYTTGDIYLDPVLRVEDAESYLHTAALKYIRSFEMLGKSARIYELAHAWQSAKGLPKDVAAVLLEHDSHIFPEFRADHAEVEKPVFLYTLKAPSRTDIMVYGRIRRTERAILGIKGKTDETFGPRLSDWIADESSEPIASRAKRLKFITVPPYRRGASDWISVVGRRESALGRAMRLRSGRRAEGSADAGGVRLLARPKTFPTASCVARRPSCSPLPPPRCR